MARFRRPLRSPAILLWIVVLSLGLPPLRQTSFAQAHEGASVSGHVVERSGLPVAGAVVELSGRTHAAPLHATSDRSGVFLFGALPAGDYTISAVAGPRHSSSVAVTLAKDTSREVQITVAGPGEATGAEAHPAQTMEFSDKPNFSIAGVTDWTAVGGHGSDATLRTSEDLARETLALKAKEAQRPTGKSGSAAEPEEELRLRKALQNAPRSYTANRDLGELYLRAARYGQAVPPLKVAAELNHAQPGDEYSLALACKGVGDFAQARQHLAQALKQRDLPEYHQVFAEVEERLGDPLEAVRQQQLATGLDPSEANYFAWGSELLLHRAIWQAAEVFAKGAKAHPDSARMKTGWGAALFAGARYDEAAQRLCEASDLNPADEEPYLFMGKSVLAAPAPLPCVGQRLARFVALQPGNANANYFYAMALSKAGQAADAPRVTSLLRKTISLDPKFSDAYLQLGILAFAQRNYAEATGLYQQAVNANPQSGEAHYRLGVVYDRTGNNEKARIELARHEELEKAQAEAIEEQRRQIKQFVVEAKDVPVPAARP